MGRPTYPRVDEPMIVAAGAPRLIRVRKMPARIVSCAKGCSRPARQATAILMSAGAVLALAASASGSQSGAAGAAGSLRPLPDPAFQGVTTGVTTSRELPGLRTEDSNTFLESDGSRLLKIADHPINYKVGGVWQPIEDRLVEAGGSWRPAASPVPVSLPHALGATPVTIGPAGRQVSLTLRGANAAGVAAGSESSYRGALSGVDAAYAATPQGVRESLTLRNSAAPSEYRYSLSLSHGLHPTLSRGGAVTVSDGQGNVAYTIAAPTISDASAGQHLSSNGPVHYELGPDGSTLTLVVDHAWLGSTTRVFPVTIDPDVYFGAIKDCEIASNTYENAERCGGRLHVGHSNAEGVTARALVQFDLSSVPRGSQILSSSIAMWLKSATAGTPVEIDAYGLSHGFTSKATWNAYDGTNAWTAPGGDHLKTLAGTTVVKPEYVGGWVSIGFSPQVEQWVRDPTSDHGILLKAHSESTDAVDEFVQTNNGKGEPEPDLHVIYEPKMGNPPSEAMFQEPIGNNGTLGVNVANGNLHITNPDVNYAAAGYDTQLGRSYNSYDDQLSGSAFGGGWRLNMGEDALLYPAWWDGSNVFHEPDGSYTRFDRASWADNHPAAGDKAYTGDAYRPETLIAHENGTRSLIYNDTGVEWQFDSSENGFPQKIVDPGGEGNTIGMSYTASALTKVTDTHAHALTLTRETTSAQRVTKIKGSGSGETWTYTYNTAGLLVKYKGPGGQEAKYTYTKANKLLESITDPSGVNVISYDTSYRVTSLRHVVNGTIAKAGSEDQATTFTYGTEETTVTHPTGAADVYSYDQFGNALEEPATQEAAIADYGAYAGIEAGAAKAAVDLQDHATILDSQLSQQLGEAYTGEWFEPSTGRVKIGITSAGYEQTVEQDLDNLGLADNVDVVTEKSTHGQLQTEADALSANLAELSQAGLIRLGVRDSQNAALIEEANTLTHQQEARVEAAAAAAKTAVTIEKRAVSSLAMTRTANECSEATCVAPLRGAEAIRSQFGKRGEEKTTVCSSGFLMGSNYGPARYILTAGHCIASSEGQQEGGVGGLWTSSNEIGHAVGYVLGSKHRLPGGGNTSDRGDEGLIEITPGHPYRPWVVVYGDSAFHTTRNERYAIRGTHYSPTSAAKAPGTGAPEQFTVCVGGAPVQHEETEEEKLTHEGHEEPRYGSERCGVTRGFRNNPENGTEHVEDFWQCDPAQEEGLHSGASGSPVYKNGLAFGIYVEKSKVYKGCEGFYEGINTIEGVFHVHVERGG
jgi:YD repeat-containing protein